MERLAAIEELEVKISRLRLELAIAENEVVMLKLSTEEIPKSVIMGWRIINNK